MRQTKCSSCSSEIALRSCSSINGKIYCEPCADKTVAELKAVDSPVDRSPCIDPTVCYRCNADGGDTMFESVEGAPCCPSCYDEAYKRAVSKRLRVAFALLLLAIGFAGYRALPYLRVSRSLSKAERLVHAQQYSEAIPLLKGALNDSPDCEKCVLLLGESLLKTGEAIEAEKVLKSYNGGHFEKEPELVKEVNGMMGRASFAFDKARQAAAAYQANDKLRAVKLFKEATELYPEHQGFSDASAQVEIELAFAQKDYDRFLSLGKQVSEKAPNDPLALAQYASALACKYAVTGDNGFRTQAEQVLEKARALSMPPAQKPEFDSYDERIQHRLKTRVIIDRAEYDRRFKQPGTTAAGK